jgi:hypothetical protein
MAQPLSVYEKKISELVSVHLSRMFQLLSNHFEKDLSLSYLSEQNKSATD